MKLLNNEPQQKFKLNIKGLAKVQTLKIFIYGLPITILLFFVFPRLPNFFPVAGSQSSGKIGYSKDIDNTSIAELQTSSQIAFRAEVKKLNQEDLYWRGRILNYTDGYNWKYSTIRAEMGDTPSRKDFIHYTIKSEQSFDGDIMVLDSPVDIITSFRPRLNPGFFFTSNQSRKKITYSGISSFQKLKAKEVDPSYLKLPLYIPKDLQKIIDHFPQEKSLEDKVEVFRNFILDNNFSYTLTPGPLPTIQSFLLQKTGFCTHYASLMALVFRHLGYPTRVISGFQGGEYNTIGDYYTVRSNDAHAWIEIHSNGVWERFDPTSYISPLRIELGGDAFVNQEIFGTNIENFFGEELKSSAFYTTYYSLKQWFDNLNYQVSLFIESFDIEKQRELYQVLLSEIKRNLKIILILLSSLIFIILFYFIIPFSRIFENKEKKLLRAFSKYLSKNFNYALTAKTSLGKISETLSSSEKERVFLKKWTDEYQKFRYAQLSEDEKKEIANFLKSSLK